MVLSSLKIPCVIAFNASDFIYENSELSEKIQEMCSEFKNRVLLDNGKNNEQINRQIATDLFHEEDTTLEELAKKIKEIVNSRNSSIDETGRRLIEEAKKAIGISKIDSERMKKIKTAMSRLYKHFETFSPEDLEKTSTRSAIFEVEKLMKNEFLPLNSAPIYDPNFNGEFPSKINSIEECEQTLDYIVNCTRKRLSENHDLTTDTLRGNCISTAFFVGKYCKELGVRCSQLKLDENLKYGMFHHFTIVHFPMPNGEVKNYIVDCTYRQFFTYSNSFLERIGVMKSSSIGAYMMMNDERKEMAEQLLTKGYIEATPEVMKQYFDAIIFCGRGPKYYASHGLDYMNPDDCIPTYSTNDYIKKLKNEGFLKNDTIKGFEYYGK